MVVVELFQVFPFTAYFMSFLTALLMVLATGHPLGEEIREFLQRGLVGWIQKPVQLADLARLLRQTLRKAPAPTVIDFQTRKVT